MTNQTLAELKPGTFLPVAIPATAVSVPFAFAGGLAIGGWSFTETTGAAAASLELWDGGAQGGTSVAIINLGPGESIRDLMPGLGVIVRSNLQINVTAGSVRGSIWCADA